MILLARVGIALRLRSHADGTRPAHGVLLPSRHDHRIALEPDRRAIDAIDDARRSRCTAAGLHLSVAGKVPALLTTLALNGITGTVRGLGSLRFGPFHLADLRVAMPSVAMIVLAAAALVLAMWSARRASLSCSGRTRGDPRRFLRSRIRSSRAAHSSRSISK